MTHMEECAILTQKYLKEVHNRSLTIEQILNKPHLEQVYVWYNARKHYDKEFVIPFTKEDCKSIFGIGSR